MIMTTVIITTTTTTTTEAPLSWAKQKGAPKRAPLPRTSLWSGQNSDQSVSTAVLPRLR